MRTLDYLNLNEARVANVVTALQNLLADFQIYYSNLRGFHWEIKGRGFFVLHEKFESIYDDTATKVDEIAERILTLGGTPENKYSGYLKVARIPEVSGVTSSHEAVDNILNTYKHFIAEERKLIDLANEANDAVTADMLTGYLKEQEKMIWMLVAFCTRNCEHK